MPLRAAYLPEKIPDEVMDKCLDLALLAPNSQNREPWQFIDVRDPSKLEWLRRYCLSQPPAMQAPHLIVALARPDFWRMGRRLAMEALVRGAPSSPMISQNLNALMFKYRIMIPVLFEDGPFHILAPFKRLILWLIGLFTMFWRFDTGRSGQVLWATRTTALACQTLMLALRAAGYDSCAMEGASMAARETSARPPRRCKRRHGDCRRPACGGRCVSALPFRSHTLCAACLGGSRRRPQGVHKAILADSPRRFRWTRAHVPAPCCEGDFRPSACSPPAQA